MRPDADAFERGFGRRDGLVRRSATIGLALTAVSAVLGATEASRAQEDDWAITRPPTPRRGAVRDARSGLGTRPRALRSREPSDALDRAIATLLARPDDESVARAILARASGIPAGLARVTEAVEARRSESSPDAELALASLALARADLAQAQEHAERASATWPEDGRAHLLRARIAERRGDRALRVEALAQAAQRLEGYRRADVERELAELLVELGRLEEARELFRGLARGRSSRARAELARALAAAGRCDEALRELDEIPSAPAAAASEGVSLALLRAGCERDLGRADDARATLLGAWTLATRASRQGEVLDALVRLARDTDGAEVLERALAPLGSAAALHRGMLLEELGRDDEALVALRAAAARDRHDAEVRSRIARLLTRMGRLQEALAERRALARAFPGRFELVLELAAELHALGRRAEALAELDRAKSRARGDRTALSMLVDAYARLGERDRVISTLEDLARAAPNDPRAIVALAHELLERGDNERAFGLVEALAGGRGSDPRTRALAHLEVAEALANLRAPERALAHLEAAEALLPEAPEVLEAQAHLYERMGRDDDAARALERLVELGARATQDVAAARALEEAEARLVASWARGGQLTRVRPALEAAHARGDASAGRMLAELHRRSGRLEEARATLRALEARSPDDARVVASIARIEHERGDYEGEVTALRRLAELEPTRAGHHYARLVELALTAYRDEDALAFAEEALRHAVEDADVLVRIGRLHARRRDPARAAEAFARALSVDPDALEAAWELASIERDRAHTSRALSLYLDIVERTRDEDLRDRAGRAALEAARAAGMEASIEPRVLSLALSLGRGPGSVARRMALSLYGSLVAGARARSDAVALERWVSRALPVLLTSVREPDFATRAAARQILFARPVRGAGPALVGLARDETIDPTTRADALASAIEVVGDREATDLRALLEDPNETLAVLALHGLVRSLEALGRQGRDERTRRLQALSTRQGALGTHARVWTLLLADGSRTLAPRAERTEDERQLPWLAAWQMAAQGEGPAALGALAEARTRMRDPSAYAVALELVAGRLDDPGTLERLAREALVESGGIRAAAERTLLSPVRPTLACLPGLRRAETLEAWLGRGLERCPRQPRDSARVASVLERVASELAEADVERALDLWGFRPRAEHDPPWLAPTLSALARRASSALEARDTLALALARAAAGRPDLLEPALWTRLLEAASPQVREAAVRSAPLPALAARLAETVRRDAAWSVRRAALVRLADPTLDPETRRDAAADGLLDPYAFVRTAALGVVATLVPETACALVDLARRDPDETVRTRALELSAPCAAR